MKYKEKLYLQKELQIISKIEKLKFKSIKHQKYAKKKKIEELKKI